MFEFAVLAVSICANRSSIGRTLYCFLVGRRVVVVHAFIKKTQQTPDKELRTARKRIKELQHG